MFVSKNVIGADYQQERLKTAGWVIGIVDGEGCFSVTIQRNHTTRLGWQVFPEFVVTQGEKSRQALEELKRFFGCGAIYVNRRKDNHRESLCRYCVRARHDLNEKIIPFFTDNPPRTAKADDFLKFKQIIKLMEQREHLTVNGMNRIARLIETMNRRKPSRFIESSETIRRTPVYQEEDIVRTP